jgi:hypothetical protein
MSLQLVSAVASDRAPATPAARGATRGRGGRGRGRGARGRGGQGSLSQPQLEIRRLDLEDDDDLIPRLPKKVLPSCTYGGYVSIFGRDVYCLDFLWMECTLSLRE